jgi:general secretion pathway protein M
MRQQAAELQAMALEASALAARPAPAPTPMTQQSLAASLTARGIVSQPPAMTGDYAKLQMANVSFANLVLWLDAQRRENRIQVEDLTVTSLAAAGQVDASMTLRQSMGTAAR